MKTASIYLIKNLKTGKVYIGQTIKPVRRRFSGHLSALRGGYHPNDHLSKSFNKHGDGVWIIGTLEEGIPTNEINKAEKKYIDEYNATDRTSGYNNHHGGHPLRDATEKEKKEYRRKQVEAIRGNTWNRGRTHTGQALQNIRESRVIQYGEDHGESVISKRDAWDIQYGTVYKFWYQEQIGDYLGIDQTQVSRIQRGEEWRHVEEDDFEDDYSSEVRGKRYEFYKKTSKETILPHEVWQLRYTERFSDLTDREVGDHFGVSKSYAGNVKRGHSRTKVKQSDFTYERSKNTTAIKLEPTGCGTENGMAMG